MEKKKRKLGGTDGKNLIVVGKTGENKISHGKKVEKLKELMFSRMERKKRVRELMAKREGRFEEKL
jgi:hypothetical protein